MNRDVICGNISSERAVFFSAVTWVALQVRVWVRLILPHLVRDCLFWLDIERGQRPHHDRQLLGVKLTENETTVGPGWGGGAGAQRAQSSQE